MVKVPPVRWAAVRVATWALLSCTCALLIVVAALVAVVALSWITAKVGG